MRLVKLLVVCLLTVVSSIAKAGDAQTVDSFEFGKISAATVKLAIGLDYLNRKCKGESTPLYLNQTNFALSQIGGRSSNSVLENTAKVMGATPEKLRQLAINEADEVATQYGGCKSKELQAVIYSLIEQFGGYQRYLVEVADLMHRNPGRNIFR